MVKTLAAAAALTFGLTACGHDKSSPTPSPIATRPTAVPAPAEDERLTHWREATQNMNCKELDSLERIKLGTTTNDSLLALTIIHTRQAQLHCPE